MERIDRAPAAPSAPGRSGVGRFGTILVIGVTAIVLVAVSVLANGGVGPGEAAGAGGGVTPVELSGTASGDAPVVGKLAPDFTAQDVDGKPVLLSSLAGKPVWVTFGASWCQPCRAENPDVVAAYERHRANGLVIVQVYMNETQSAVADYAARVGIPYVKIPDPDARLANDYRILGIPTHYFIDRDGVLRSMRIGSMTPAAMDAAIEEIGG